MLMPPKEQRIPLAVFALLLCACAGWAVLSRPPQDDPCARYSEKAEYEAHKDCVDGAATQSIAEYTQVLAYFTVILAFGTLGLAGLAYWQGRLARDEFNATHRPKIKVLGIELFEDTTRETDENGDEILTQHVWVNVKFVNKGTATATISEAANILLTSEPTASEMLPMQHTDGKRYQLKVGEAGSNDTLPIVSTNTMGAFFDEPLYCVGYIEYLDAAGTWRKTGWCWKTVGTPHKWERVRGSPFDYSY